MSNLKTRRIHTCGNKLCWSITTFIFILLFGGGIVLILDLERDCVEWTEESDSFYLSINEKTPKMIDEDCKKEAINLGSCLSKESDGCTLDTSGNDESSIDIPDCAKNCVFNGINYKNVDSFEGRRTHCTWLKSFPLLVPNNRIDTSIDCLNSCYNFDKDELNSERDDCLLLDQYPNGCCEEHCINVCSKSEDDRKSQFIVGFVLGVSGLILTCIFACGICPVCCFGKDIVDNTSESNSAGPIVGTAVEVSLAKVDNNV